MSTACGVRVVVYSTAVGWITSAGAGAGAGAVLGSKMSGKGHCQGSAQLDPLVAPLMRPLSALAAMAALAPISGLVPTTACARASRTGAPPVMQVSERIGSTAATGFSGRVVPTALPTSLLAEKKESVSSTASTTGAVYPVPLMQLLEEKQFGPFFGRVSRSPKQIFPLLQDAGVYGVLAYGLVFVAFYTAAALVGETFYRAVSGGWFDPRVMLLEDGADGKAEALATFAAFYLACKPFGPVISTWLAAAVRRWLSLIAAELLAKHERALSS